MLNILPYRLWRHPSLGFWNGYVGIPKGHPLYEKGYSDSLCGHEGCYKHTVESKLDAHGGITYSGKRKEWGEFWWFGFDTGHSFDDPRFGGQAKSKAFVRKECLRLARQLQAWKDG